MIAAARRADDPGVATTGDPRRATRRTRRTRRTRLRARELGELHVERVDDDGRVVLRFPGGWSMELDVSAEMTTSYRKLLHDRR